MRPAKALGWEACGHGGRVVLRPTCTLGQTFYLLMGCSGVKAIKGVRRLTGSRCADLNIA